MGNTIKREMTIEVRVGIDDPQEREDFVKQHNRTLDEIDALGEEAKQTGATYRKQINDEKKKELDLRLTIQQGKPVQREVVAHFDFGAGRVSFADKETGKFYKDLERDVTDEDRQMTIHDSEAEQATAAA